MTREVATKPSLVVSEVFGPTLQGEGPHAGRRAAFVRLGGCNLSCSWCDTPYTWNAQRFDLRRELSRRSTADIAHDVFAMDVNLAVISGGEPLLQQGPAYGLIDLATCLVANGVSVDVETNGTIVPSRELAALVDLFVVSPKLPNAGMDTERRQRPESLQAFGELAEIDRAIFKFVCASPLDLAAVQDVIDEHQLIDRAVWIMPEGTSSQALLSAGRRLAEASIAAGFNFTTRLHVLLWGNERAR